MRFVLLFLIVLLPTSGLIAQGSDVSKAQKLMEQAQEYIRLKKFDKAEKSLVNSLKAAPSYPDAYSTLGFFYVSKHQYTKAAEVFEQAAKSCPKCATTFALPLAEALCKSQQYNQAAEILNNWAKPKDLKPELEKQYNRLKANIQYGKYAATHVHEEQPVNMGPAINSRYDEYFPSITPNDSVLVFTRKTSGIDEDFYKAHRDSCGGWFLARDMGSPPNSIQQEGAQFLSADGHYLFFMRCGNRSENGWEAGGCDLYFSYTEEDGWSQPVAFGATINTTGYEGMPTLSSDNRELFFVSGKEGGYGGMDIWVTRFEDGLWQIPENLGPEINTPFDETAPFIAPDNSTLYFTSNGHPGVGGNDIFRSERNAAGLWQHPVNLGLPINSAYEDVSFCISADGRKGYFSSNRPEGVGGMDMYEVQMPQVLQPKPVTFVVGSVYDSISREPVTYAQVEFSDVETGEKIYHFVSNRGDGTYMGAVNLNRKMAVRAYRIGYLEILDTLEYSSVNTGKPDTLNFPLLPNAYVRFLEEQKQEEERAKIIDSTLLIVRFQKNEIAINEATKQELKWLLITANRDDVEFHINGYTDNTGKTHINEEVSFARARALADCLKAEGVPEDKLRLQGWADANPVAPNDTEENRNLNRRVELIMHKIQPVTATQE